MTTTAALPSRPRPFLPSDLPPPDLARAFLRSAFAIARNYATDDINKRGPEKTAEQLWPRDGMALALTRAAMPEPPQDEGETEMPPNGGMSPGWREWRPRQVEARTRDSSVPPARTDSMVARSIDNMNAAVSLLRGELEQHKASTRECLNALADEAGAETGKQAKQIAELKTQVAELQSQLNEARGEISLVRALQPKRLMARKSGSVVQIEGSLTGPAHVN
jgi:hypothetical protein